MFANSDLKLKRKLFSYEIEADLRISYCYHNWSLMPGIFFTYQRIEQKDSLNTALSYDPTRMTLSGHINSNHCNLGVNFHFTVSHCSRICWLGHISVAGEYVDGRYEGKQTFAGDVFDEPIEQLAEVNNHRHKWGISVGSETGFCFFCNHKASISILGNFRYINKMPYVVYPVPILNTQAVTGPAKLNFQHQLAFGGEINLTVAF